MHYQLATGKNIRILTIFDIFSKLSHVVNTLLSYRSEDVVKTLVGICVQVGYPKTIRVDQDGEFVSRDLDVWVHANGVILDFTRPG